MHDQSYRVILEGTIREGFDRRQVVEKLTILFKKDATGVDKLLSGKPRSIRTGLEWETAVRYVQVIEKAGAVARIEAEVTPGVPGGLTHSPGQGPETAPIPENTICPRCGYQPTREDDVMLVRGDCPKCGLLVRKIEDLDQTGAFEGKTAAPESEALESMYGELTPASRRRRAMASAYTFGLFVIVYCCLVVLFMFVFFPLESIPLQLARDFLFVAFNNFPIMLTSFAIFLVTFVGPIFMGGRTWGQKAFDIVVLYPEGGGGSGQLVALAYRTATALLLSYAPGLLFIRICDTLWVPIEHPLVAIAVMALLAWSVAWYFAMRDPDRRGALDIVAGCIQTEEKILPQKAWQKAIMPGAGALAFLAVVGLALPLLLKD